MSGALSARITTTRKDFSGVAVPSTNILGGIVIDSVKGRGDKAVLIEGERNFLANFGKPSAKKNSVFEALAYNKTAPLYVVSPYGDGSLFGGVDVRKDGVNSFPVGRNENFTFDNISLTNSQLIATGDGITKLHTGTLLGSSFYSGGFAFYNGATKLNVSVDESGNLTGDITGTIDLSTGAYSFTYGGSAGSPAVLITEIDLSSGVDLSIGSEDKFINLTLDGEEYENINLGQSATFSLSDFVDVVNLAVGKNVASIEGNFLKITGTIGDTENGDIILDEPSYGESGFSLVVSSTPIPLKAQTPSISPTGSTPKQGVNSRVDYVYFGDGKSNISHTILTSSPVNRLDELLGVRVESLGGSKFKLTLFLKKGETYSLIEDYTYSLNQEVNAFGESLYYEDIFENNPYIQVKVNVDFEDEINNLPTDVFDLTGGYRVSPTTGDITEAWKVFENVMSYPVRIFIDCFGSQATTINSIIDTYNEYAKCFVGLPFGNKGADSLISAKESIGVNNKNTFYYGNWEFIRDDYNNSKAWVSNIGYIAGQWAKSIIESEGTGFITAAGEGLGQISGWSHIKMETESFSKNDYLKLDTKNVNILVFDKQYGLMIVGDKTSQTTTSDTSYIKNSFGYDYIIENVVKLVLESKVWKHNNDLTRLLAKSQAELIVNPLVSRGWLREVMVKCDSENNNDAILAQNKFVLEIFEKVTPNVQRILFNFIQVGQTQTITEIAGN